MAKERFQNPTCGDDVNLRLLVYNSNNLKSVKSVDKVEIYFCDPEEVTQSNPDGRRLVETFTESDVVLEDTGKYLLAVSISAPAYTIGNYVDVWTLAFEDEDCSVANIENPFVVHPDLWFTTPTPPVYDFSLKFRPGRIRKGSKQYLIIHITPNVPTKNDLNSYYENLAIVSDLRVSIRQRCGECMPVEEDLRLIADRCLVDYREKCLGYFFFDTTDLACGIYDVWFELCFGENLFITETNQLEIYE
jgi:hypothetical protein